MTPLPPDTPPYRTQKFLFTAIPARHCAKIVEEHVRKTPGWLAPLA
ncbi:hypothetical protein CCHOA_02310 [Corynebacterium choanae]|uniref:Uncharacterized protein n=1 Tax=Corynebacterium choanae TaxID=1862358 RepID=A0A3G6J4L2_9CORY|nr:hypothetical protein CCHOA_02310 [Corynebacterium choanae]